MSNFTTADERTAVQSVRPARLAGLHYHSGPPGLIEDLMEMWRYRDVLWMLVVRDIKVRYRQAVIGAAWAVIQPALATLVFLWLFTRIRNEGVIDHAYPVSAYLGLICWQWFANSAREGTQVLVANRNLITKVYFPRLLLPLSPVLSAGVDFLVATAMLPALYYWYAAKIDLGSFYWIPCSISAILLWSAACSIWLSALNAMYRDLGHVVPFLLQIGMFAAPVVVQTSDIIPPAWMWVWGLNPLTMAIEGLRSALLGTPAPTLSLILPGATVLALTLAAGIHFYRRTESWIADRI